MAVVLASGGHSLYLEPACGDNAEDEGDSNALPAFTLLRTGGVTLQPSLRHNGPWLPDTTENLMSPRQRVDCLSMATAGEEHLPGR